MRFWRLPQDEQGCPVWLGAATFDGSVGFSHTSGQITHHIDTDLDRERDPLLADLRQAGCLSRVVRVERFHTRRTGHNGGGDRYHTDGDLVVGFLAPAGGAVASRE